MTKLRVEKFSCIKDANLELSRLTVLIGPQASGKSVLCKLCYFFLDVIHQQQRKIAELATFDDYKIFIKDRFFEWFPVSAWGSGQFVIEFTVGEFVIKFTRTVYGGVAGENIRIWASEELKKHYADQLKEAQSVAKKTSSGTEDYDFEFAWHIRQSIEKSLKKSMGRDYVSSQLFIPAGRSFFTSIGRAVAAFEHGGVLDPLILDFGRMYAQMRDRNLRFLSSRRPNSDIVSTSLKKIFGGELQYDGKSEFVLSEDGRRIPISALSSGQQELLPLLTVLPRLLPDKKEGGRLALYIEEPEAHLFPLAQSKLIEVLASIVSFSGTAMQMILTTHSPYVLSKINNLIKAGTISRRFRGERKSELESIIPSSCWMGSGHVNAYAIIDGKLNLIIDEEGMIAADYLDDVSSDISNEFSSLLRLEYSR